MTGAEWPGSADPSEGFRSMVALLNAARRDEVEAAPSRLEPTPVTLLTGFLGSGKTTVIRRLLQGRHGLGLTAIVNDLGAVGVDAAMLDGAGSQSAGGGLLSLADGCACCLLTEDLADALDDAADSNPVPDAIVVEASGAADPVSMAATIEAGPGLRLDGIVCVVDVERWPEWSGHPMLGPAARRQLESAHLVVLTKTDLVSERAAAEVVGSITELAPGRQVLPAIDGHIDPAVLLGAAVRGVSLRPPAEVHRVPVRTKSVRLPGPVAVDVITDWLENTDHGLVRAKGWLAPRSGQLIELQVVGRRWTLTPTDVDREPVVVLIATDQSALDRAASLLRAASARARRPATG